MVMGGHSPGGCDSAVSGDGDCLALPFGCAFLVFGSNMPIMIMCVLQYATSLSFRMAFVHCKLVSRLPKSHQSLLRHINLLQTHFSAFSYADTAYKASWDRSVCAECKIDTSKWPVVCTETTQIGPSPALSDRQTAIETGGFRQHNVIEDEKANKQQKIVIN
jgi:hypothetical protein